MVIHLPGNPWMVLFNSMKLAISSASLLPLPERGATLAGDEIRRPKLEPSVLGSRAPITNVDEAQREFLRMALVTARISACRTFFSAADLRRVGEILEVDDIGFRKAETNTSANTSSIIAADVIVGRDK